MRKHTLSAVLATACLMALVPAAVAEPLYQASLDPPPERQNKERDGYYLRLFVLEPEAPRRPAEGDDCAAARPQGAAESALTHAKPLLASQPDPRAFQGVSPWFPACVAVTAAPDPALLCGRAPTCDAPVPVRAGYVAWNVGDGRVYVEPAGGGGDDGTRAAGPGPFTLRLPFAMSADCEDCPPGNLLA